jgi:hypothetical protein
MLMSGKKDSSQHLSFPPKAKGNGRPINLCYCNDNKKPVEAYI